MPEFFIESWIYSSALSVVEMCDTWVGSAGLSKASLARYCALKGELMELAQQQVDAQHISGNMAPNLYVARYHWYQERLPAFSISFFDCSSPIFPPPGGRQTIIPYYIQRRASHRCIRPGCVVRPIRGGHQSCYRVLCFRRPTKVCNQTTW